MDLFLQYLANGIVVGSSYVLVAVGLTLIFGILGIVNFAHGEFYMLGGFAGIGLATVLGLPLIVSLLGVVAFAALLGFLAEQILNRQVKDKDPTNSIVSSFGLAVVLQNAALLVIGPQPMLLRTDLSMVPVEIGPVYLPLQRALIPVAMIVLVGALHLLLRYTWVGMSLRAMAQQPTVARMCGIRVSRVAIVTFMTGAVFAGVAGFLMSSVFMVHPLIGNMIVLKAFTVVILGGMGSVTGAAAAGLMLGIVESMTSAYLGNGLRDIVGFLMVVIVLLAWPQGIFGRKLERS
ncbi:MULTISPECIES: branched-chain amino acid ABC transporter permease [Salipiger]|uniref:Branched-chain amino acid transport system permease protein n=1 Tax=Salipiger thiooxidans TaxID=282683 RepID=A0A1G7F5L4_9RHOB|nr:MULTISPECIES: branched-chain amino acid ABC transporter permease [Salipiger]MAU48045.1 branched-chain amino acid ABC transporter permease [Salipiger sp.]NVK60796.1 branched-chain amino acid ABC transporter permease [Paracoccaceae bacterium]MCA0846836.1 branched-chain amino acid ABC transporter permease [Salipiger thiooxidans]NIY97099.1 branched-chain amino acid ABC transporter permease [Salipiger sp. HF18]SDE71208.1 branched-chain amino acid transport system permease protein [Salipiger thio